MSIEQSVEFQKELHALVDRFKPGCTPLEIVGAMEFLKHQIMVECFQQAQAPAPKIMPIIDRLPPFPQNGQ